ncbi:MAG: RNA polymerase subunit sigma [Rhodobacteraceae bacterium]|nr:RNA polymerase subunit sigma [Paracoccaceae bacterium]
MTDDRQELERMLGRIALGDRQAFSELFDHAGPKLFGLCLRVLKDRAEAQDALQDSFVKVWRHADRFEVSDHHPMSWLITIARNTAIDRLRALKAHEDIDDHTHHLTGRGAGPEAAAIARSEAARIRACLAELPEDRRNAVQRAYLEGDSYADLADRYGIPLNTVRTWLRRGLMALRECMSR